MPRMPALFVSHGAPDIAVKDSPAHRFLKGYGAELARPTAILIVSAHWETTRPTVATAAAPQTIYDFGNFDPRLRQIRYAATGAPDISRRAAALLAQHGLTADEDAHRGYDHGVWTPLHLLYPSADIPVAQVSIQPHLNPAHHLRIGQALAPLRDDGVLVIGSGAMTHNLRAFFGQTANAEPPVWVSQFTDWMHDRLVAHDTAALVDYRIQAPFGVENHPEDEHILPLFVALGAAGVTDPITRVHGSYDRGVLAMDVYRFG